MGLPPRGRDWVMLKFPLLVPITGLSDWTQTLEDLDRPNGREIEKLVSPEAPLVLPLCLYMCQVL